MRVLLGLAALAASVNAAALVTSQGNQYGDATNGSVNGYAIPVVFGVSAIASVSVTQNTAGGSPALVSPPLGSGFIPSSNWYITVGETVSTIVFHFATNQYSGQIQYRWSPDYPNPATLWPGNSFGSTTYTCDMCTDAAGQPGSSVTCSTAIGPGGIVTNPALVTTQAGFRCANLSRQYTFSGLQQDTPTVQRPSSFSMQIFDTNQNPAPNVSSYSFLVYRNAPAVIVGDPQIVGMQGQDFQVHGIPDEVFNMITYPTLQVNARFSYLDSAECHDNFTACFAHPGTYISEEGFRVGKDKVRVTAGSFKKGLTVTVNGKKTTSNVDLKQGAVEVVSHRRVVVHTSIMKITISNSDKFLNQELELSDDKLVALGSKRRTLKDNERFHAEVPLHGLQGQTWRNVEYPSGLDYEGSITDYHVVDGNLFGTDFVFNHFDV